MKQVEKYAVDKFKPRRATQDRFTRDKLVKREKARTAVSEKLEQMRLEKEFEL